MKIVFHCGQTCIHLVAFWSVLLCCVIIRESQCVDAEQAECHGRRNQTNAAAGGACSGSSGGSKKAVTSSSTSTRHHLPAAAGPKKPWSLNVVQADSTWQLVRTIAGKNVRLRSVDFVGQPAQAGIFTGGSSVISINSGIVLSSGLAIDAMGPGRDEYGTLNDNPLIPRYGYSPLGTLTNQTTYNAAVLTITFECEDAGELSLDYVFASEEYSEEPFADYQWNDVMGMFLDGEDPAHNIATLYDGSHVSVNQVNCDGSNPLCMYYVKGKPSLAEMNGFTRVLQATSQVDGGKTYEMKIAVADGYDGSSPSWVFIAENSLLCPITSEAPSVSPSAEPTVSPSASPSAPPSALPSESPTHDPTPKPQRKPTRKPTPQQSKNKRPTPKPQQSKNKKPTPKPSRRADPTNQDPAPTPSQSPPAKPNPAPPTSSAATTTPLAKCLSKVKGWCRCGGGSLTERLRAKKCINQKAPKVCTLPPKNHKNNDKLRSDYLARLYKLFLQQCPKT